MKVLEETRVIFHLVIKIVLNANQKAKISAGQKYERAKERFNQLDKTRNKTPEQKNERDAAKREMDHWKKKQDFSGENHSRNAKGN